MAPNPARVPLSSAAALACAALSGCLQADPTLGMLPRADIGSGQAVASFERQSSAAAPVRTYAAPPAPAMPRAAVSAPTAPVESGSLAPLPPAAGAPSAPAEAAPPQRQAAYSPPPAAGGAGLREVQFLPIVGAPPETVARIAEALARNAPASNVSIVAASSGVAPTRLKGYLSAMTENGRTSVIYVWDVLDAAGNRINRIQGQETAAGAASADPWASVGPETIDAIARRTLAEAARGAG